MKKKPLYKILIIILLLAFQHSLTAEPRLVRVGALNYYPCIFKDKDGEIKGLFVDLLSEIGKKENIRFEYVFGSWNDGLERIKTGEVDLLTSAAYTKERSLFMDYCKTPLLTVWGVLYTQRSSTINDVFETQGKIIGVMQNDFNGANFIDLTTMLGIKCKFLKFENYAELFEAIAARKVDAGVASITYGAAKQAEYGLRSTGVIFNPFYIYFTTAKGKNSDLRLILDRYLNEWQHQDNSVLNEGKQKWLHGSVGAVAFIPGWLNNALIILGITILVAFMFIILLKRQVKRATDKIRESEQRISSISNNFQNGMIYQLIIGQDGSRKFTYLSNSVKLLYGISPEEGMADSSLIYSRVLEQDAARLAQEEDEAVKTLSTFKSEFRIKELSGAIRWSYRVSTPKRLDDGSTCFDGLEFVITERKKTEAALRESEERYRSILNASPDDITITDLEGHILMLSPVALTMFGYEREDESIGRLVIDYIAPEDRDRALSNVALMSKGNLSGPREYRGLRADGSTFDMEVNAEFIRDADGQPNSIVLIVRDITERKHIENKIKTFNAELEQRVIDRTVELEIANRELESFSYSVSHDLRAPLRAIDGFSLAIIEEYNALLDAQGQDYLRRVRAATVRMADLIDDLLKLSRVSRNEMHHQEVSLSNLVNNIISNLQQVEPERQVKFTVEPDIIVHGDEHLLTVMLENLLGNAWKFTGNQPEASIEFGVTKSEGELVYYVRDNGAGFDMAYADKLFGAFQRMHSIDEFPGTGIGLATVRRIISRHNGRIWAEAEVGKGATFYFTLKSD